MASKYNRNRQSLSNIISNLAQESAGTARRSDRYNFSDNGVSSDSMDEEIVLYNHTLQSGDYVEGTSGWRISGAGNAEFENVRVRGEIQAETGLIGGFTIGETALTTGSGNLFVSIDSSGENPLIYAGDEDPALAPFKVSKAGNLTAEKGDIAGWTLKDKEIFKGEGSSKIALNAGTNPKIYIGTGTFKNSNTAFFADAQGRFSLFDDLIFDPAAGTSNDIVRLTVNGRIRGIFEGTVPIADNKLTVSVTGVNITSSTQATITTAAHAFVTGEYVTISGVPAGDAAKANGTFAITVLSSTTFRITISGGVVSNTTGITGARASLREVSVGYHPAEGSGSYARTAGTGLRLDPFNWWMTNNQFRVGTENAYFKWDGDSIVVNGAGTNQLLTISAGSTNAKNYFSIHTPSGGSPTWNTTWTQFIVDGTGKLSLGQNLTWDGSILEIDGRIKGGTINIGDRFNVGSAGNVRIGPTTGNALYIANDGAINIGTSLGATNSSFIVTNAGRVNIGGTNGLWISETNGAIWLGASAAASAEFSVASSGNVRIGADPAAALHVIAEPATSSSGILFIGEASDTTSNFRVTKNGQVDIGGITTTSSFHVDSAGNVWVGATATNRTNAPFQLSNTGAIRIGTTASSSINITSTGNVFAGSSSFSTAPFTITASSGKVKATDVDITGVITGGGSSAVNMGANVAIGSYSVTGNDGTSKYTLTATDGFVGELVSGGQNIVVVDSTSFRHYLGSETSPCFSFIGDTNTGMYRAGADDVRLTAGGTWGVAAIGGLAYVNATALSTTNNARIDPSFGLLVRNTSKREMKENIQDIEPELALTAISLLSPRRFIFKPFKIDNEETAALRAYDEQLGFIAEEVADVSSAIGIQIHEAEPPYVPEIPMGASEEETAAIREQQEAALRDLDSYVPSYWKEPHMIALCVAAIKGLKAEVEDLRAAVGQS